MRILFATHPDYHLPPCRFSRAMANVTVPVYITYFTGNSVSASENKNGMEKYLACFSLRDTAVSVLPFYSDHFYCLCFIFE